MVPVAFTNVKFCRVEDPFARIFAPVTRPVEVMLPALIAVAERFVEEAVVAKKFVEVALVVVDWPMVEEAKNVLMP